MTEAEWLATADPNKMPALLGQEKRDRSTWLFAVACFRWNWAALDESTRQAVKVAERYVEGRAAAPDMLTYNTRLNAGAAAEVTIQNCSEIAWTVGGPLLRRAEERALRRSRDRLPTNQRYVRSSHLSLSRRWLLTWATAHRSSRLPTGLPASRVH